MAGLSDPLKFTTAEDYFNEAKHWKGPTELKDILTTAPNEIGNPGFWRGITLKFNDNTLCVIQFIRPTLWRVRYDPAVQSIDGYGDHNSRTIIGDSTSQLIADIDEYEGITWTTKLEDFPADGYWVFSSTVGDCQNPHSPYKPEDGMQLYLYKTPFRIQAIRSLKPVQELYSLPPVISMAAIPRQRIVWQTSPETFRYKLHDDHAMLKDIVLDVIKAGPGEFIGWGEQGGTGFMKKPTYMNYFNMDNMRYNQIYAQGPTETREPLYHSDPYWLDVNSNPEHLNVTATFVDNYSQIAVDFGKTNAGYLKIGTRFNAMDVFLISGDNVPDIVRLHTSIIGRSALKPRYILGNHQACFGYTEESHLFNVVEGYRNAKIPLDGLHIDVDFQNNFRTFTHNPKTFPDPERMFRQLAEKGVKCSTNITPIISLNNLPGGGYKALEEGLNQNRFIMDDRYTKGAPGDPNDVEYFLYKEGKKSSLKASALGKDDQNQDIRPNFVKDDGTQIMDDYRFRENYDSKINPFHGGVWYGGYNGTAGYYPNLNNKDVRIWWGTLYEGLFKMGLEFVWQDMTTPALHPAYGDMKGLPSRLWVSSDAVSKEHEKQLAIEIWALYSYNLHKATFHGLNALDCRKGKRNFILGRGSFAGMYRYAGLWSGDNASTWDFWRITIPQVLSLGLNGVCITGADTGGFEADGGWCDPELLIRWYAGSFLLPWLRNHYTRKERKEFQEPYEYPLHFDKYCEKYKLYDDQWLYYGARDITQYFIRLRYSLLQLLYDTMFENQINGMPIARSMLLTDTQDTSFFNESQEFLDNQYVVGHNLLIAPVMYSRNERPGQSRDVYLPLGYFWYPSNLRPEEGVALGQPVEGGSVINFNAAIPHYHYGQRPNSVSDRYPYVTPMYIREGAIIPQIGVRDYIEIGEKREVNQIKFNIYPLHQGKVSEEYTTYLDDGVSRNSAPKDAARFWQMKKDSGQKESTTDRVYTTVDGEAGDKYRAVTISQITEGSSRIIRITKKDKAVDYDPVHEIGSYYTIILWYGEGTDVRNYIAKVEPATTNQVSPISNLRKLEIRVEETLGHSSEIKITVAPPTQ